MNKILRKNSSQLKSTNFVVLSRTHKPNNNYNFYKRISPRATIRSCVFHLGEINKSSEFRSIKLPSSINATLVLEMIEKRKCELKLYEFIRTFFFIVEPGVKFVDNWHIVAICEHLEAVFRGDVIDERIYNRLLVNIPPGTMKSLIISVFFPAWCWIKKPWLRFISVSHSMDIAIRDGIKMRRVVTSELYQKYWPNVQLNADQNSKIKFENTAMGFRQSISAGGITGARADIVIVDDPHSVDGANSDATRKSTLTWFSESLSTRVNDPEKSAIIVVMQRLHQDDVAGHILDNDPTYDALILPMHYDPSSARSTRLGFSDPRTEPGELLFPERFSAQTVAELENSLGPYAAAGQLEQQPAPRGGGIIKSEWWRLWDKPEFPHCSFVVAALDTAYTEKAENDPSAMSVFGVWSALSDLTPTSFDRESTGRTVELYSGSPAYIDSPQAIMMHAWAERLQLHDLVMKVVSTCRRMKVDTLLIENKASGHSVAQELRRLFSYEDFGVQMYDPKTADKTTRVYAIQHIFSEGMVWAPDREWSNIAVQQMSIFPRGKHDDIVDTISMNLSFLRKNGMLSRSGERNQQIEYDMTAESNQLPLYSV